MDQEIVALSVVVAPQPETLVIVDVALLEKINELSGQVKALAVITNDVENEALGALLKVVTQLEKEVEDNASAANKPFHAISKAISEAKAKASKPLATIKAEAKNSLTQFILKRDRERAEAEAALEVMRAAEAAELAKVNAARAAEAAAQNAPPPAPLVVPVSQAILARPAAAKTDATKVIRKKVVRITDPNTVPRVYCVPDLGLIEAAYGRGEITPEFHPFFVVEEVVTVMAK
jgi:hypothetical protein